MGALRILAVLALLAVPGGAAAQVQDFSPCWRGTDDAAARAACTAAIGSGGFGGAALATLHYNRALRNEHLGDMDAALQDHAAAIRLNPDMARAYAGRGTLLARLGRYNEAILDFDLALILDPNDARAFAGRGHAFTMTGRADRAVQDFDHALGLSPGSAGLHAGRAQARCAAGDIDGAMTDFARSIALDPPRAARWQEALKAGGFYEGEIDGQFGRGSRMAQRAWAARGCPGL